MLTDGIRLLGDSDIERELISRRGDDFPAGPVNGQLFQINLASVAFPGKQPGIYFYSEAASDWIQQTDTERDPYDIGITAIGRPKADDIIANRLMVRTAIVLADFTKSLAIAKVAPTSDAVFDIAITDLDGNIIQSLGNITFLAGQRQGTYNATVVGQEFIVNNGEILSIKAPVIRDATIKDIEITIAARLAILND